MKKKWLKFMVAPANTLEYVMFFLVVFAFFSLLDLFFELSIGVVNDLRSQLNNFFMSLIFTAFQWLKFKIRQENRRRERAKK